MSRLNSPSLLQPYFARQLLALLGELKSEGSRLSIFETARTPFHQMELYAIGRDPAKPGYGKHVTDARAYQSAHQFGLGADLWPVDEHGNWVFVSKADPVWEPLMRLAPKYALECISWERPHVQAKGFDWKGLAAGPMETEAWFAWLQERNKT